MPRRARPVRDFPIYGAGAGLVKLRGYPVHGGLYPLFRAARDRWYQRDMGFIGPDEMRASEPLPGWKGRFWRSDSMSFAQYAIDAGASIHEHHHPNEEVWNVVDGELEMVVGDIRRVVRAGDAAVIPAGVEHSASASGYCRAIVVDYPVRERIEGADLR